MPFSYTKIDSEYRRLVIPGIQESVSGVVFAQHRNVGSVRLRLLGALDPMPDIYPVVTTVENALIASYFSDVLFSAEFSDLKIFQPANGTHSYIADMEVGEVTYTQGTDEYILGKSGKTLTASPRVARVQLLRIVDALAKLAPTYHTTVELIPEDFTFGVKDQKISETIYFEKDATIETIHPGVRVLLHAGILYASILYLHLNGATDFDANTPALLKTAVLADEVKKLMPDDQRPELRIHDISSLIELDLWLRQIWEPTSRDLLIHAGIWCPRIPIAFNTTTGTLAAIEETATIRQDRLLAIDAIQRFVNATKGIKNQNIIAFGGKPLRLTPSIKEFTMMNRRLTVPVRVSPGLCLGPGQLIVYPMRLAPSTDGSYKRKRVEQTSSVSLAMNLVDVGSSDKSDLKETQMRRSASCTLQGMHVYFKSRLAIKRADTHIFSDDELLITNSLMEGKKLVTYSDVDFDLFFKDELDKIDFRGDLWK